MNIIWKLFCVSQMGFLLTLLIKKECSIEFTFIALVGIISYGYCLLLEALKDKGKSE